MDLIFLLLASQLLMVIAIILTNEQLKGAYMFKTIKAKLSSAIVSALGLHREDDHFAEKSAVIETSTNPIDTYNNQSASEEAVADSPVTEDIPIADESNKKLNAKRSTNFENYFCNSHADSAILDENNIVDHSSCSFRLSKIFKWLFTWKFLKFVGKISTKKTVKSTNTVNFCINSKITVNNTTPQQSKPIKSAYLAKIIAIRKSENAIRMKVSRLNLAIFKQRKVRPLLTIAELAEPSS